jgi:glycolate oxidase
MTAHHSVRCIEAWSRHDMATRIDADRRITYPGALPPHMTTSLHALVDGAVLTGDDITDTHRLDRSGHIPDGRPEVVVLAASVDDVRHAVTYAAESGLGVVPRGAGSGLAGGASAGSNTLVLDVSRLNRIEALCADDEIAVVEAGVITAELDRRAGELGLRYAPDPASAAFSTIGGNIATNAGGLRCVKYGVTRDSVLGVSVVLADGALLHTGRRTTKGVAGLDLTSLFTGSEGTLGVIVGATLRLHPIPADTVTVAAWFDDAEGAAAACTAALSARVRPSLMELMDEASVTQAQDYLGVEGAGAGAFVVAQTDGFGARAEADVIAGEFQRFTSRIELGDDREDAEQLLAVRRAALPALERLGQPFIEDIAVPRSKIGVATRAIVEISRRHDVPVFTLGHAGDGNLHPIIVVPGGDRSADQRAGEAADEIFALALDLGGTITGEHGIGVLKRRWLAREIGETAMGAHRAIRRALDPRGVFNPGKVC